MGVDRMQDGKGEQIEEQMEEHRLEIENRIRNLFWTVSGDYSLEFEPDVEDYARLKNMALYEAIKQGAFARHFDQEKLGLYLMKKLYLSADEGLLLELARLCIDAVVYPFLQKERFGTEEIRARAFREWLKDAGESREADGEHVQAGKSPAADAILAQAKELYMRQALQELKHGERISVKESAAVQSVKRTSKEYGSENNQCMKSRGRAACRAQAGHVADEIFALEHVQNTDDVIAAIEKIYNSILDPSFESKNGDLKQVLKIPVMSLAQDAWQECMSDEQMEGIIQKYLSSLKKKMMSLEIKKNRKKRVFSNGESKEEAAEPEEINPQAAKRIREYVELNYGKSYLTALEQERMNRRFCNGIHKGCTLYLTDGILQNPVMKNNQYRFSQLQYEKNKMYYGSNHWIIKRNITILADSLKKSFVLRNDDNYSRSVTGKLVPGRLWKVTRTKDEKLFDQKKKSESSEFVVDILLDSSGSQAKRQSQVAAQGYIISEALSEAGIPHRVSGYCAFWGYTVLQRFRDYEDAREANSRIFQFRAYANNRDGLALKTVCASLLERPEENKILIVLSDGRPCDMSVKRPGLRQPAIYDGEEAIKDTATEVRRARNQGICVIGVFVGSEEDLSAEKRIFGKDFAYIRNISNFSRIVGTFLRRQIDAE